MWPYDVLQQGLPMNVVPYGIETKGTMSIISLRPRYPTDYFSAFKISDGCLIVQDWTKYMMGERREVLGGSKQMRYPRLGDRFICMLQLDQGGQLYMFYVILPKREQQEWLARNEFEDNDVLHYYYDDKIASVGGNDWWLLLASVSDD